VGLFNGRNYERCSLSLRLPIVDVGCAAANHFALQSDASDNTSAVTSHNEDLAGMTDHPINRVSGFAPIIMSLVALLAVAKAFVNFTRHGPPLDEDGPWHVFMLSMFVQLPIILYFIFEYRRALRRALPVLATQLSQWGLSMGAACYLSGIY
jgi:hypothetical protein